MTQPGLHSVCTQLLNVSTYPLSLLAVQCWRLCSPAPSKKKKKNPRCRGSRYTRVCSENSVLQLVCCLFSSLLVGIRANFTHIRVVADKTGCHRLACNVSWAWFLLWAGSAALHFYSSPPKTIPCVIWLRKLSDAENIHVGGNDVCEPGPSGDPQQRFTRILPALHYNSRGWLSAPQRTSVRPPPPLVRNQNGLGLSVTAASSQRQEQSHQKVS